MKTYKFFCPKTQAKIPKSGTAQYVVPYILGLKIKFELLSVTFFKTFRFLIYALLRVEVRQLLDVGQNTTCEVGL